MPGTPLRDPDLKRLRALRFIEERIKGKSLREIASEFNVSKDTVERTLSWAKKAELVVEAEDRVLRDLLPKAHNAIATALASENAEIASKVALEIFKGTLPSFSKRPSGAGAPNASSPDLASYINQLRSGMLTDGELIDAPSHALPSGVEERPERLIEAGSQSLAAEGLSEPAASDGSTADEA